MVNLNNKKIPICVIMSAEYEIGLSRFLKFLEIMLEKMNYVEVKFVWLKGHLHKGK
jgi:hypothetical protein